jgi:hypothetical protein
MQLATEKTNQLRTNPPSPQNDKKGSIFNQIDPFTLGINKTVTIEEPK